MWVPEVIVAGLLVGLLAVLAAAPAMLAWQIGAVLVIGGLALGVPLGLLYHRRMAVVLAGQLGPRWWWDPISYHGHLKEDTRMHVLRPFYWGAICCGGCFVGCAFCVVALLRLAFS